MTMDSGTGTGGTGTGREGEFEIVREFEVGSPPREVWEAVTTGTGGWLWPMVYEPRAGGAAPHDAVVTVWDPPRHLAVRSERPGALLPEQNADRLDYLIEPRDGGRRSWVRHAHGGTFPLPTREAQDPRGTRNLRDGQGLLGAPGTPGASGPRRSRAGQGTRSGRLGRGAQGARAAEAARSARAALAARDRDDRYEVASAYTDFHLHSLRQYLTYFAGRPVVFTALDAPAAGAGADAFARLAQELGLPGDASEGARVRLGAPTGELDAVIDFRTPYFIGLRTEDALHRFFGRNRFGRPVAVSVHDFAPGADAKGTEAAWHDWLTRLYA